MSVDLITTKIWPTLTAAARRSRRPAAVAVAYFGRGAAKLLPLRHGSCLVVDAGDAAVKSGQTCPAELKKLITKGTQQNSLPQGTRTGPTQNWLKGWIEGQVEDTSLTMAGLYN